MENEQIEPAYYFLQFALDSWKNSSPVLANRNIKVFSSHQNNSTYKSITSQESWRIEKFCTEWVSKKIEVKF